MPINRQQAFFLNTSQASTKNLTVGRSTWQFQNQMDFGVTDTQPTIDPPQIGLLEFSFTNWFINISSALGNNKLYFSNDPLVESKYTITIPDGSYSLASLNEFVSTQQTILVSQVIFSLQANYSTNKVCVQFSTVTGYYVHFGADSPFALIGFTSGQNVPASKSNTANYMEYGSNIAQFNNITGLSIVCNMTTDSISNGKASSTIYQTMPVADIGSTQSDRPNNIIWATLTNTRFDQITIQLLDQNGIPINMSEEFALTLIVKY